MRSSIFPGFYRLSFVVPRDLVLDCSVAEHADVFARLDCVVTTVFGPEAPWVEIKGRSREAVFDRAALFLAALRRRTAAPLAITAILETPADRQRGFRDSWTILLGAEIAFSPTSIDPYFPRTLPARPPPELLHQVRH